MTDAENRPNTVSRPSTKERGFFIKLSGSDMEMMSVVSLSRLLHLQLATIFPLSDKRACLPGTAPFPAKRASICHSSNNNTPTMHILFRDALPTACLGQMVAFAAYVHRRQRRGVASSDLVKLILHLND